MLFEQLKQDMMSARKNKESDKAVWLSALIGELQRGGGKEFEDAQVLALIKKHVATLKENLKVSPEHAATQNEVAFLQGYLPQQMSEDEIRAALKGIIAEGGTNMKALMTGLQTRYAGLYDGRAASAIVKEELAGLG
ncbi:MAG: GatB/YqeY domain-containing protein [Candidatus Sericytochromatia bacterium]